MEESIDEGKLRMFDFTVYNVVHQYNFDSKRLRNTFSSMILRRSQAGNLILYNLNDITLPEGLTVYGYLKLRNCSGLISLPTELTVKKGVYLQECVNLKALPSTLKFDGELDLSDCNSLTYLPEGLTVNGDFDLTGCTSLVSLPHGLVVHGTLTLEDCKNWDDVIPDDARISGRVYI